MDTRAVPRKTLDLAVIPFLSTCSSQPCISYCRASPARNNTMGRGRPRQEQPIAIGCKSETILFHPMSREGKVVSLGNNLAQLLGPALFRPHVLRSRSV